MKWLSKVSLLKMRHFRQMLFFCFPLFLNLILYLNMLPPRSLAPATPLYVFDRSAVSRFLLSTLLLALLFFILNALLHRAWLAGLVLSAPLYVISLVDFYKFYSLGTRIAADDIVMVFSLADLWNPKGAQSGGLFFSPMLLFTLPFLLLLLYMMRALRVENSFHLRNKRVVCLILSLWMLGSVTQGNLAYQIFDPQMQAYEAVPSDSHVKPQLTSVDCLIGSLYYDDYEDPRATKETVASIIDEYAPQKGHSVRPDIIVIMSESYFDLNRVKDLKISEDLYTGLRRMQNQGGCGRIAVPAFGGGTASTEYEVLSGTSNAALQDTRSPYSGISDSDHLPTFCDYFKSLGYESSYVHPFKSSFYNRFNAFTAMGFDHLLFQDTLTVPLRDYPRDMHISDETLTDQILAQLKANTGAPQFIWATSMQNHTPYVTLSESDPRLVSAPEGSVTPAELDGINAYAVGLRDTNRALERLLDAIDQRDRPTALLFFGDHHPLLEGYKKLNHIGNESIYRSVDTLTTDYAFYTNYSIPKTEVAGMPENHCFSAYYLMDVFLTALGMPKSSYLSFLDAGLAQLPLHTARIPVPISSSATQNWLEKLEILSYDRHGGEHFSAGCERIAP